MKKIKILISAIVMSVSFVGCGEVFKYLLVDDTSSYTRIMMHELYNPESNIDILFVGSSHCYRSFVPQITDEIFNKNTFNAGTSSQQMDGSLAIIKEAVAYNDIEQIYLELYFGVAQTCSNKERTEMVSTYIISDYMKPSVQKIKYLLNASSKEHYINSFMLARRNWEKFFESDYVLNLLINKQTHSYKNYEYIKKEGDVEYYVEKGYVANISEMADVLYWNDFDYAPINVEEIDEDWEKAIKEIIELCNKKGIKLSLVTAPMPQVTLISKGNYDEYVTKVRDIIAGTNIKYYDFNLCREEYFTNERTHFLDTHHLNAKGAEVFSTLFSKFFTEQISEEELFYNSFEEKLLSEEPKVYGICGSKRNETEGIDYIKIVSNREVGMEYQIIFSPVNGQQRVIQEFSENKIFGIPMNEHGIITIIARMEDTPNEIQTLEIGY